MSRSLWMIVLCCLALAGCGSDDESAYQPKFSDQSQDRIKEYVVGIHPLHNPQRLMELYGPIVEYIDLHIPEARFRVEASRSYEEFDHKLFAGEFDFAMPNPYETVRAMKYGYRVFAKMGDDEDFRGIILVRRDSGIQQVEDLRGRIVAYPAPSALAATMMPQYYLHTHGLNVNRDIENRYVGSQESTILNVFRGHAAAGATWPLPWKSFVIEHPEMASQIEVKWQTTHLPNNAWVARSDVPAPVVEKFGTLLVGLHDSEDGRRMLQRLPLSQFEAATNDTYLPVEDFLKIFTSQVRQLEW